MSERDASSSSEFTYVDAELPSRASPRARGSTRAAGGRTPARAARPRGRSRRGRRCRSSCRRGPRPSRTRRAPTCRRGATRRVGDAPVERDRQPEDELGDRGRVLARAVRDVDAALARRPHVDRLHLRAGAHDEVELARRLDRFRRHLRRADDEDADALDRSLELLVRELGLVDDFDGESAQLFDRTGVQLVGNEETHVFGFRERALALDRWCPDRASARTTWCWRKRPPPPYHRPRRPRRSTRSSRTTSA